MEETIVKFKRMLHDFCPKYCEDIAIITDTHVIKEESQDHLWKVLMVVIRGELAAKDISIRIGYEQSFAAIVDMLYTRAYKDEEREKKKKNEVVRFFEDVNISDVKMPLGDYRKNSIGQTSEWETPEDISPPLKNSQSEQ